MAQDKLDILYDALERDGAVTSGRENFRAKMLAPGEEGYKNRLALFTALKQDNAVESNTYEEFAANLGLHAVKPAKQEDPAEEQGGAAQPNADDYARAAKNNALAVARGRDVLHQAENAREWQKANFGLNVPKVELGLGKSGRTVATAPTFNAKTGKQERTYITQSGNEYTSQASAEREQAALDRQQEQARKLAHVQEEIDRKRQEELAGIDKQLTVMQEQYDRIKGTDQTSETRRGYIMQAIDRLQQQRDAAEKKYRGRDAKAEYELGGGREQLEAAKEEVAKALEDIEERRGEKSGFMEFAENQFPNVTSYIRRWTDPEYGKAKAAEQALEDTENTIKQATREGFSNNTAFNVARGAWDATRDIRTWDFGANDWADSRNLAELVDKSERIRKAEEAGKTPEEHLTATEQRVLDAMAVSSTLDANFSEHVPMSYRVGQSVPASAGFAASIYLNPLNGLGAAVEKQVAANAAKGGMKEVLKGAMKTAGKTVMKNVTGAPTMNAAEQSMQRALTVAAVNKYGKWGVRAMNTAGRVIGDGVEALGTTLTTGLPRTMASINERQTGTFIGRVDDSGRIVYDRVEDRETGAKSYLKGGLASYFENQSELVGEYFSPIKNFANLAAKDMPLARSMVERFIASSPKQKASLLAEFRKKAHISGLFGEYAEEVINNLENAVFTGDMNLTGGVFEPKREDYKSDAEYNEAVNDWKGSMFNAETNLETFLSVAAMIMPMAAIEQGQKRYNSYTVKRQLNTSADALRKSLGEETAVPLMTRMREAESIKDICDVYMSVLKDGGLKDSKQARALMDYAGKLVAYQSVNTSDMSGEISANRVQRGYKSAFDAGHEMAADERHNAAVEFDNAAATATEMLGKDFVMAVRDMDLPQFQEILKTLNWEQKKAATDVYLSSVRLSGILSGARDRVDEEADKYGNTLNLMSDEEGNAWRGSNLGENEYVVPSSLSDEGSTLVVRDMETGALRMIPREEAGELTAVNASEETEARRKQLWEQAKDEVRWNLNHHNKTVQPAVGETVSISMRKSEDEEIETQRFLIVKEDEEGNFYLLPTRMNEAGEEEAISGTPFKATADELLSSQDYVYEQEDAAQRDAERSAVEETTEGGATEETPTDGSSVVIEGAPATEEDAPADTAVPTRSEVAAQLDATEEGRSARAMVDGWVRDENDAETIHEWIDIVDESEWDAKTKQLLHDYVDSKDAPDEEGPTGGSSAVVESEAAPVVEGEAAPAVESKATPKIPLDKDGAPQYDKAPVQATVEDLYDGTLDDKEVGEFIEAQIAEADKNVKKLEKRKPKVGTDKAKYLASKKKWEDELEDARHKAQYWNDVKAEVERIITPADAQGWEGELNDDNARAAYRAQRKVENGIPTQQEFIADFMASAKIAPESFRKETGGGTLEQKQWAGRIAKEGDSIERLSEKLVDLDNTENGGRFFGGDSAVARDAIIDFLKSGRDKTDQEQEFVEQYNAQRDAYYNERYGMSYEDYIAYTEQEMPEMLRRYSNFDEQEFTMLYADEIEEDLRRREEQAKQQNNGTEGNDSAGEEQSDGGSHQVQPGERTDDTRGGEERADTRAEEDAGDEGAGKPEAAQENAGGAQSATGSGSSQEEIAGEGTLNREEAITLIAQMEERAEVAPQIELTIENWDALFNEGTQIPTPVGDVKMGENQFAKLMRQGRNGKLGMLKPTLENPDFIVEDKSEAKEGDITERGSSYVFVKTFHKADGSRYYYFTSVTVRKDGREVVISNQEKRKSKILDLLLNGKLVWKRADDVSTASDVADGLYSSQGNKSDLATEGTDAPQTNNSNQEDYEPSEPTQSSTAEDVSKPQNPQQGGEETINAETPTTSSEGKGKEKASTEQGNDEKSVGAKLVKGEREATSVRLQKTDNVDVESMAAEHGLDGMWLSRYAEGMRERNSAAAAMALHDLKAIYLREHIAEKKALMERDGVSGLLANKRLFEPVEQAIKAKYGDVDVLIEERRKQAEIERGMMEAARKRYEEEQRKREARLKELAEHTDEEIDNSYAEALAKGDEATAREMLDEAARRKGYGDAESDYQGVSAWGAPSKPDYETDEARRNAVGEDSPDLNVEDMAAGYSNQPEDIFAHPDKYSQGLPTSKESGKAIQTAIDDIRNGKKDVKIKVYRAVPTTVKEGKLRNGDWVTSSKRYAELHGDNRLEGKYRIIEDEVPAGDLWWDSNDVNEWGYDNGKSYRYKNVKNNRKLNDLVTRDDNGNIIPPSKRFNSRKADERYQRGKGAAPVTKEETILRDAVIDRMRENGMDVITNEEEGQRVLEEANGKVMLNSMASSLAKAASTIKDWLTNNKRGKTFRIELPLRTSRMVREVMGRDFKSHNITANGIAHAQKNHGVNGAKLNEKSIPLTKEDMELLPYIMTAPDYVRRGSNDATGRASVRFYKELSNGYVVVAEKEYKNSPDDMETITMWAEKSDKATNAQRNAAPDTHVQNAILDIDVAKIHKDAEDAIANDVKVRENRVWHGSGADFEAFDHSHMGEGEGSQAFGWGTYVTNSKDIGFYYATRIDNDPSRRNYLFQRSNGARFKKKYPTLESFLQDVKRMGINDNATEQEKTDYYHKMMRLAEPYNNLYTVEIPNDNGKNYLDWDGKVGDRLLSEVNRQLEKQGKRPIKPELDKRHKFLDGNDLYRALSIRMPNDDATFNDDKAASEFLYSLGFVGIKYPADSMRGGRADGAKNYVIFNEKDAKITDHVRFFRTADGEAYGFTVDGKIYIDPKIANSETPVHEYAHLWASALRQSNAKEWANVVGLMKDTAVWEEVKKRYPELKTDDEIADEVLATYSGRRGAERLRKEMEEATKNGSIFDKAEAMSAMQKIRQALDTFWNSVADFLHIHYTTAEEVADRVMKDLLDGVDPRMMNDGESVESISYQRAESEEESLEKVNEKFNEQLAEFTEDNADKINFNLGSPSAKLLSAGVADKPIRLHGSKVAKKMKKHGFSIEELHDLPKAVANPIAVFDNLGKEGNRSVLTELKTANGNFLVAIDLGKGTEADFDIVSSVFGKKGHSVAAWINKGYIRFVDKKKALNYLHLSAPIAEASDNAELSSAAKVIQDFENPKVSDEKVSEDDLYRVVDDKETIERLDAEPKITAYRAMQVIDGKLYSPMAAKVDGKLTDSNPHGAWTEAEETLFDFTPEQKAAMEALDKSNEPGNVELIKGKLRYNKQSKNGKGTLQFHLVKGDGSSLWAAYNPYIHSSMSMLNDQFTSAYKRPNIVVVEVEIPESELTSGYRAQNAKNTVGMTEWKAGPVAGQLPGDMARQVMLSRWSKVKRIVPYSEVSDQVAATLSTAEEKTGQKVQLPIESFHPELRKELEKRGFEFQHGKYTEETAKRKAWDDLTDEEKQQAYKGAAYMDDAAIEALNSEYRGEWLKREGEGQATDEEVSLANDPVSKMIGKSRYSAGQQVEYAENMRERMTTHAQELAEKLHLSNVEIVADGSGFTGKRQKAKGFYNKTTGKITVIIGNHTSIADVEKTILHEAVAHYGLRQLFGEHFDQFLDNVYESCSYKIQQKIDALMEEKGYDQHTATEEYLASLAEDMNYETTDPTFWTAIKEAFLDMLHTLGFDYTGPVLTDNELRYILWRSYKNLEEPGSFRSILGAAEDLKMQETLGVGQYETEGKESAAAEDLFREDDISRALNNDSEGAGWSRETMQRAWDDVMSKASFLAKEGYFDYLASVDEFQKLVERATGEKVSDMQNAYKAMLQLSSRNANEMKLFDSAFARPLQRAVYRLIGAVKDFKKGKGLELSWYLISKHGIERNRDMAIRAAMKEKAKESYAEQIHEATAELKEERTQLLTELTRIAAGEESTLGTESAIKARVKQIEAEIDSIKKHPNKHGLKTEAEFYEDELDNWYRTASFIKEYAEENGWTWRETQEELTRRAADFGADVTEDYSGLSALVEEEEDFTEAAYRRVENYENAHYTDDLWEAIRAMSGYSLEKQRSSGLTTKKYVDEQLRRYDFFVPLRGWADPTAEEMYDYLDGQRSELGNPVKTAKGRKSEADNPLGGLLSVAYRSIASGNKNLALQHFYNLVSAHNTSGLAVIDSMWIENRGTEDAPDWVLATPELTDPMTGGREMNAEEVQAELDRFNADMREKAALGMAIQMKKGTPLPPYRVTQQHARAHQIRLSVGGTNRVITIVGNPRVAMALNGLLNPENSGWPILRKLNNFMAGAFTNYNVSFGGANLARDTAHSNLRAFIGESPAYWWALTKKQNLLLGNVANWARMVGMLRKYEAGKPMTGYHERMFKEFMDGGGATGYTMIRNQKESTQFMVDMVRDLKNIKRRKLSPMRMFEFFSFLNEAAELVNRFVAYETSREMGRTRERSIDDAKEATLNFNRKGAGAKSLTQREGAKYRLSNALNYYSQYGRSFIVFFNAHVQGTYQLYRLVKEHPEKFVFAFGAAPITAAAVALPLFNNLLLPAIYSAVGGDGDDDWGDYYYELSDWERQHNICLRLPKGHGWLKIPLTPELGAMFQVGDVTGASFAGKRDMQASDLAGIMELVAPNNVDFTDAGTAISSLVPSSLQWASHIAVNRDFKGSRLRNDNMFSRYQPEYLRATRSTSATITAMSRALNKVGGGNDERSADNVLDFSPGYMQEMLTGIAGGWASTALAVSDALAAPYLEGGGSEKDYWKGAKGLLDRGGVPVLSRFWISGSGERNAARAKGEYMRTVKPFMGATESEFSLIKRIPRPAALNVRAKEEKLEAAKKSHDLFAIAEAEKALETAKANFEEAKKTQRQKLDALQGSERFKAYRDMRGITRYIDYMLRLYKDNDLPANVVDSLQEANRRLLEVEK